MSKTPAPSGLVQTTHLIVLLLLTACAGGPPIATATGYQYTAGAANIHSYRIEFAGMPEFLKPMLRDEISRVLAQKGLRYTEGDADAILLMTFINDPLPSATLQSGSEDNNGSMTSEVFAARFNARIKIEMTTRIAQERIWSGTLSRVHYVTEGDYMHEAPARDAMRRAFGELFAAYPARRTEYMTRP
ncbi:MAG: hypothetical protein HKP32_07070 [Woeseia sp.]|nr:hypothetical protein [Woeseia sp.]